MSHFPVSFLPNIEHVESSAVKNDSFVKHPLGLEPQIRSWKPPIVEPSIANTRAAVPPLSNSDENDENNKKDTTA
jgi:hypothetical protein